jgi:hypothetical protein
LLHEAVNQALPGVLDQALNLSRHSDGYYQNAYGGNEKWLVGPGNIWYFVKPNGELWRWDGSAGVLSGTFLGQLDPLFWEKPEELWSPRA